MQSTPSEKLVTLATVSSEIEAQLIVNLLDSNGISAFATGGLPTACAGEGPCNIRVLVMEDLLEPARSILERCEQQRAARRRDSESRELSETSGLKRTRFLGLAALGLSVLLGSLALWADGKQLAATVIVGIVFSLAVLAPIWMRWLSKPD